MDKTEKNDWINWFSITIHNLNKSPQIIAGPYVDFVDELKYSMLKFFFARSLIWQSFVIIVCHKSKPFNDQRL